MAKIAVEFEQGIRPQGTLDGRPLAHPLEARDGWKVSDLICYAGPQHRPFEEQHPQVTIAIVLAGTFQYRAANGRRGAGELMSPGTLLLGNAGQHFECGHEHGMGDRCLSFSYAPDYFERLAADAGTCPGERRFRVLRLPLERALSPLVARACARTAEGNQPTNNSLPSWEELAIQLASRTLHLANGAPADRREAPPSAVARVTRAVRMIERMREPGLTLERLAKEAGLSPYHFLRTFQQITGTTPHQYVLRICLREAARRLVMEHAKVLDVALDCGFGDVSNFNRAFRNEFGVSPREFRGHDAH